MEILTVIKSVLEASAAVSAKRNGGVWISLAKQGDDRPNIMIMLVGGGQEYSHQGPDGLFGHIVRVYSYGRTAQEASELGRTVQNVLEVYTGTAYGHTVSLCQHMNTNGDYLDESKVHRQIDDFNVHYRRT